MHLLSTLRLIVPGTVVLRPPSFWERVASGFGARVDLSTDRRELAKDVLGLVDSVRTALVSAGITDATCLAVDDQVVFFDRRMNGGDLEALASALRASADRFSAGFQAVTLVFEQTFGDLEILVEAIFSSRFREGTPAAELRVAARVASLRRAPSEPQDEARKRVAVAHADPSFLSSRLASFTGFCLSLEAAMKQGFPEAAVDASLPRAVVLRPRATDLKELAEISLRGVAKTARPSPLLGPEGAWVVDPADRYYKDLGYVWVDLTLLDEMMVPSGSTPEGETAEIQILTAGGKPICDESSIGKHTRTLMPVHRAASHDFTEPDAKPVELKHYQELEPGASQPRR